MKEKKKVLVANAILFAALFGLVSLNKEFLRPAVNHSEFLKIITGCLPNFLAAYLISMAAVTAVLFRKLKHGRYVVYIASFVVFAILSIEELKPMWGASTHYDKFDIIASGLGSFIAALTFEIILQIQKKKTTQLGK
jgi:hypothetical protein